MTYGSREFLFLWSEARDKNWPWPEVLHEGQYLANADSWLVRHENGVNKIRVSREAQESLVRLQRHVPTLTWHDVALEMKRRR